MWALDSYLKDLKLPHADSVVEQEPWAQSDLSLTLAHIILFGAA